jgi:hypothetical protein
MTGWLLNSVEDAEEAFLEGHCHKSDEDTVSPMTLVIVEVIRDGTMLIYF